MALFIRVFASLFLLFSQSVFSSTQVYFDGVVNGVASCSESYQTFCDVSSMPKNTPYTKYEFVGCNYFGYSNPQIRSKVTYPQYPDAPEEFNNTTIASKNYVTCNDGEKLQLNGCTATCVADACASKKDSTFVTYAACGTVSCPSGYSIHSGETLSSCRNAEGDDIGATYNFEAYANSAVKDKCSGTLDPNSPTEPTQPLVKKSVNGGSSTVGYCPAQYIYTGLSSPITDSMDDLNSMSFGVTPTTEDGQCPTGNVKGQLNGEWVCVPEGFGGGAGSGCPAGQIKNNSGTCVPFAEAGTGANGCPTGQTKNASGVCVSSGTGSGSGCPTGETKNSAGVCVASGTGSGSGCPTGQSKNSAGVCMSAGTGASVGCPPNYYKSNDTCVIGGAGTGGGAGEGNATGTESKDCAVEPACSGDPVNCSILRQSWFNNCQLLAKVSTDDENAVNSALSNTEGQIDGVKSTLTNSLNNALSTLPTVPISSACVADSSFKLLTATIPIPLSKLCPYFQTMRSMLLLVSYLFAARIIFGSINGGGIRV